ncbi:putative reverse transcriptase domain-containing protein [Tanacetum coccineum]
MSTSKTYQQSLADASSETRSPMLERGSYIPWAILKLQTAEDLQGDALLHYDAEMELMNLILLSIPNDFYNSGDACTSAKDMWKRVERLMRGTIQNKVDRETHFTNEFDQFVAEPGEALVSVYNRFAHLQLEWLKYVTQVRLAKRLTMDTFDDLFYYLQQFKKLVNVSKAKKLEKSHDPLALDDVHTNSEDPLTSAILLLARAITQNFSTPTNNHLRTSSNTRNQAIIQGDRVNIQSRNSGNTSTVQCYNCSRKGHYARNCPKPRVRDSKYFMEQMLLAKQDEAGVILTDEHNDFLFVDASRMEEIEELVSDIDKRTKTKPKTTKPSTGIERA